MTENAWQRARNVPGCEIGSWVWLVGERRMETDEPQARLLGLPPETREVEIDWFLDRLRPEDRERLERGVALALDDGVVLRETLFFQRDDDGPVWLATRGVPLMDDDGVRRAVTGVNFDVTDEQERIIHSEAVAAEMGHRVKNILTVVRGMARMLARETAGGGDYQDRLLQRLDALADVHTAIYRNDGEGTVPQIARRVLGPLAVRSRVTIEGPDIVVNERAVQTLTMAITELATNALKHGALRSPNGKIKLAFHVDAEDDLFVLNWDETTDETVQSPTQTGYGMLVLERATSATFDGAPEFHWEPNGLKYRCVWPLSRMTP